jgi:hypothetical protein
MQLNLDEQAEVEQLVAAAETELLSGAMAAKVQMVTPSRIAPMAVGFSRNEHGFVASIIALLDISQRVATIRAALRQVRGFAFVFLYDGFVVVHGGKRDALLLVSGTAWGRWNATASPYEYGGVGAAFDPVIVAPEAAFAYYEVFADDGKVGVGVPSYQH